MPRKARAAEERSTTSRRAQARRVQQVGYKGRLYVDPSRKDPAFVYRWVRTTNRNQPDQANVRDAMAAGWQIVSRSEWPDYTPADMTAIFGEEKASGIIDAGGLVYMKRPKTMHVAHQEALRAANLQAIRSVRRDQMEQYGDKATPIVEESATSWGNVRETGDFKGE